MSQQPISVITQPFLYKNGLQVAWASNTTLTVQPGLCRDSTNAVDISLGGFLGASPVVTTINGAVNGLNGLDTGALANNKFYAVYVIADAYGFNQPATIISLSATAPTMPVGAFPANYSNFRRIGWVLTNGSAQFLKFYAEGNAGGVYVQYDAPIAVLTAGIATVYSPIDLSVAVPSTFGRVKISSSLTPNAASDAATYQSTGSTADWYKHIGQVAAVASTQQIEIFPLVASNKPEISYKVTAATDSLTVTVLGYMDVL